MSNNLDYTSLLALKAVYQQGSFNAGAAKLNVTQSAISQRIKNLESLIGTPLLRRSTPPELTDTGKLLISHMDKVSDLELDLRQQIPQINQYNPAFKIAVNADSLSSWWFPKAQPIIDQLDVEIDIVVADQDIALQKLRDGEVLACLCTSSESLTGAKNLKIKSMTYRMYANLGLYKRYFEGHDFATAIPTAPAIVYGRDDRLHDQFLHRYTDHTNYPQHKIPDAGGLTQAICSGLGYGLLADDQINLLAEHQELINIAPEHSLTIDLYWHQWRNTSQTLTSFGHQLVCDP